MKKHLQFQWQHKVLRLSSESIWNKGIKFIAAAAFIIGIFIANFMGREQVSNIGILNDYFMERFEYTNINGEKLFFYLVEERVPILLLLLLLVFSSLGILLGILMLGWQGFSIGFMLATAVAKYGGKGILLILAGLFPQYLIYLPVYIFYCFLAIFIKKRTYCSQSGMTISQDRRKIYGMGAILACLILVVFFLGIFLESYVNPMILKKVLKIF
ncbi:MAG: stage II sporulation protein M [Lachnospiraceae bacterium]